MRGIDRALYCKTLINGYHGVVMSLFFHPAVENNERRIKGFMMQIETFDAEDWDVRWYHIGTDIWYQGVDTEGVSTTRSVRLGRFRR
jgi:hypothetical protein